jgi:hypothetical protein
MKHFHHILYTDHLGDLVVEYSYAESATEALASFISDSFPPGATVLGVSLIGFSSLVDGAGVYFRPVEMVSPTPVSATIDDERYLNVTAILPEKE